MGKAYKCLVLLSIITLVFWQDSIGQFSSPIKIADGVGQYFHILDADNDGDQDILAYDFFSNKEISIHLYTDTGYQKIIQDIVYDSRVPFQHVDLDNDGIPELIGRPDLNIYSFDPNSGTYSSTSSIDTLNKTSECDDLEFYIMDSDNDGKIEIVYHGESHFRSYIQKEGLEFELAYEVELPEPQEYYCTVHYQLDTNEDGIPDYFRGAQSFNGGDGSMLFISTGPGTFEENEIQAGVTFWHTDEKRIPITKDIFGHSNSLFTVNDGVVSRKNSNFDEFFFFREPVVSYDFIKAGHRQPLITRNDITYLSNGQIRVNDSASLELLLFDEESNIFDLRYSVETKVGWVQHLEVTDYNNDGWQDILYVGDNTIYLLENTAGLPNISGTVYYDQNGNQIKDEFEPGIPNVQISDLESSLTTISNQDGEYVLFLPQGERQLSSFYLNPLFETALILQPIFLNIGDTIKDYNIAYKTASLDYNLNLDWGHDRARCNTQINTNLALKNRSSLPISGKLRIELDSLVQISSSSPLGSVEMNIIEWDLSELSNFENQQFFLELQMPEESFAGETLIHQAYFINTENDTLATSEYSTVLRCAYDPNDKAVSPYGISDDRLTLFHNPLEYHVRFQNTGNDTAYQVVLVDILDDNLDRSSIRILESSHENRVEINNDTLKFFFENIYLPDSITNFEASQGYVIFEIQPKSNLAENTVIRNEVSIFFDINDPIKTNQVFNTLVSEICTLNIEELFVSICAGETYNGYTTEGSYSDTTYSSESICPIITNLNLTFYPADTIVIDTTICTTESVLGFSLEGTYELKDLDENECEIIIILNITNYLSSDPECNTTSISELKNAQFTIYPNPAKNSLIISAKKKDFSNMEIRDISGKLLRSISLNKMKTRINISSLKDGVYFVTVYSLDGHSSTRKIVVAP